jgi:DNA mismatch endonuclease (patch repair protein)
MQRQRRSDTAQEIAVRRLLTASGLRYRVNERLSADLRWRADIVFRRAKVAVFLDGCFWHSCPRHRTAAKANAEWWSTKLAANRERDRRTTRELRRANWTVLRFWEHTDPQRVLRRVLMALATSSQPGK